MPTPNSSTWLWQAEQFCANSASARARGLELTADQLAVAAAAGLDATDITQSYTAALNGFAAKLNTAQLAKVTSDGNVMMVLPEQIRQPQTDSSIEFLELNTQGGAHRAGLIGGKRQFPWRDPAGSCGRPR